MAQLARVTQKVFGASAGFQQIAQFGSLEAGTPTFTTSVSTIQALSNYDVGWFNAVIASNSPAIEDMNALFYMITSQQVYGFQAGIPAWDAGTTYYPGSIVSQPVIVFTCTSANATAGATYTNNGVTFTVQSTISAGTTLIVTTPSGLPTASGTLTKATGTGDATITYSANLPSVQQYSSITSANLNQPVTTTAQWLKIVPEAGAANAVLSMNSAGTGSAFALLVNSNVSASAAIDGSKLVAATASVPGVVTTAGQIFAGLKQYNSGISLGTEANTLIGDTNGVTLTVNPSIGNIVRNFIVTGSWSSGSGLVEMFRCQSTGPRVGAGLLTVAVGANSGAVNNAALNLTGQAGAFLVGDNTAGDFYMGVNGVAPTALSSSGFGLTNLNILTGNCTQWASGSTADVGMNATTGFMNFIRFTSSAKYKDNIRDLGWDTSKMFDLVPREWENKSDGFWDFGFVSEEAHEICPELVTYASAYKKIGDRKTNIPVYHPQTGAHDIDESGNLKYKEQIEDILEDKVTHVLCEKGNKIPDSIRYKQMVVPLFIELRKLRDRVAALEAGPAPKIAAVAARKR